MHSPTDKPSQISSDFDESESFRRLYQANRAEIAHPIAGANRARALG